MVYGDFEFFPVHKNLFIGFGGNVIREKVKEGRSVVSNPSINVYILQVQLGCDWFVTSFDELTSAFTQ